MDRGENSRIYPGKRIPIAWPRVLIILRGRKRYLQGSQFINPGDKEIRKEHVTFATMCKMRVISTSSITIARVWLRCGCCWSGKLWTLLWENDLAVS